MEIKALHTRNFMGLTGDRKWVFPGKIGALCAPNGTGKTSMVSAMRYAISGLEPEDEMIHAGAQTAAAQIDTPKGSYMRIKKRGKANAYKLDGKTASLGDLQRRLDAECGCSAKNAKILTSSELLKNLDSRQFGDLLIQYLPEMMDKEAVIGKVKGATQFMKKFMSDNLPDGEFGPEALDTFFAFVTEERRRVKKEILQLETAVKLYGGVPETQETEAQLRGKLEMLQKRRDEAVVYEQNVQNYLNIKNTIERNQSALKEIDAEIAKINAVRHSDGERTAVEELMMTSRKAAQAALDAKRQDRAYYNTLKEAVDTIRQPYCPLSKNIHCTTDKTAVLDELKEAIRLACESFNKHNQEMETAKNKALETEKKLKAIDADNAAADRKEQLENERKRLSETTLTLPEKPAQGPDLAILNNEIEKVQKALQNMQNRQKAVQAAEEIKAKKILLTDLEHLHESFSPKGEVKEGITKFYLDEFSGPLNEKARQIFPGMTIKFVSEDGVKILVDVKGIGTFVTLNALSGGEKTCVIFLLMLLFSSLSGLGIIIMDELSVLDAGTMDGFLTVLENNKDEYDLALIACVNHDDSQELLKCHNIPELQV